MAIIDEIKQSYRQGGALTKLIYINIGVFVLLRLLQIPYSISSGSGSIDEFKLFYWLAIPAGFETFITRPWTLLSYMFMHYDFLHIIANLIMLYIFGKIFLEFLNPRQLLGVYILGGISGGVLYLLGYNFIPSLISKADTGVMIGASGSVVAILLAIARYAPNHKLFVPFIGPILLKYIALVVFMIDVISIPTMQNTGGVFAHIGGAAFGYLYGASISKGTDMTLGFNRLMDRLMSWFKPKSKMTVTHRRPMTDMEFNARKVDKQKEIDRILEKIKASGYDSLSKDEKQTLFDASK